MGSLVLDVLRKGIWSSFTGGWYYDPSSATFTNTFHLYLFLFFLCFPFSVYVYLPRNAVNWLIYTSVVACVFVAIKLINIGLHRMFDTSECIIEEPSSIDITLECDKRKPSQKPETRGEEEGIELQVLSSDKKRDNQNENNSSFGSLEFADFNATAIKDDVQATTSGTIDLKVDVHRKNSSDSSDGTFFRSDKVIVVDEVSQESSKEKISSVGEQRIPDVTSSEEVLVGKDLDGKNVRKRNLGVKEGAAQDGSSTTVDVSDNSRGRLSERSRQYSVSVTLGEGKEENTINDPTPARSMQLNSELEADSNKSPGDKGLLYWKQKWAKNPRYTHGRVNATMPPEISISGTSRRSSSPLSIYTSDIVYPIAEHSDEQPISSIKRSSAHSDDDDDDDEDYVRRNNQDDDDMYGDIDDDPDVEMDSSHSPLLSAKHNSSTDNNGSSYNIASFNRKKRYVDSLTRKYRHMLKNRNESEIDDMFTKSNAQCSGDQNQIESLSKDEDEQAEDYNNEPPSEDDDQIAAIFDWLFSQNGNERGSTSENLNRTPSAKELKTSKKVKKLDPLEARMKEFEELKAKYPNYLHATKSQSKFSSTPTLASGSEKSHSHRRQRSGTCSQLEINLTLPENERKSSLNEVTGQCSTSVDVYTSTEDQKLESGCPRTTESNEASSSGSNNELSSLLPFPCVTPYINSPSSMHFYHGRRTALRYDSRNNRNRHRRQTRRSRSSIREAFPSASSMQTTHREPNDFTNFVRNLCRSEAADLDGACTHIATSYDDTTEGAVHIFQDENGQWMSYTFDERGSGIAVNVEAMARRKETPLNAIEEHNKNTSCASLRIDNCTTFVNSSLRQPSLEAGQATTSSAGPSTSSATQPAASEQPSHSHLYQLREHDNGTYSLGTVDHPVLLSIPYNQTFVNSAYPSLRFNPLARLRMPSHAPVPGSQPELHLDLAPIMPRRFDYIDAIEVPDDEKQKRRYYKFRLFPFSYVKIYFDRLSLDALLDYNETYCETLLCIMLAVMVSLLGAVMLHMKYYHDIPAFIFCFVIATSHYSLLKSVQPDAASPVHGFNKVVAFSRPVYFVFCCSLIIGLNHLLQSNISWSSFSIYEVEFHMHDAVKSTHDFLCTFILFFPVFFTLGMFPQINTFLMYVFEQIDMHVFGGSAVTSLKAASYCVFRSVLAVLLLFGFAYGALSEPKSSQHILFSIFISLLVMFAYHLSRCTCDPAPIWNILVKQFWPIDEIAKETKELRKYKEKKAREDAKNKKATGAQTKESKDEQGAKKEHVEEITVGHQDGPRSGNVKKRNLLEDDNDDLDDPLPAHVQKVVNARLQSDLITSCIACVLIFSIHRSTIFTNLQPELNPIMWGVACLIGFLLHYIMPQLRKQLPWLCIARPVLRSIEHELFEAQAPATVTWFEKVYMFLGFVEKNIIYPVMFIGCLTSEAPRLASRLGPLASSLILTVCSLKCLRLSFSHPSCQYLILAFSVLFFRMEWMSEAFVVDYFLISIVYYKLYDLLLKIQFVLTYIAPWQITWGSAFHAFAQPFSLPHSAMMFAQAVLSAFLSSPLYPFLGSAIFLTSYPRPVKFWERDYNTRRVDHSNTKMASHLERNLGADDNNLNSIFYEHLTRSLQRSLCGDLLMGRWGEVSAGDCFILASDYLNCLIHIVELGNGLVTFQMRGLEFRGTYCQQREVEAITDGVEENDGCCCCKPGHLPFMLSLNAAFSQRWLAWEVTTGKYILEGYSISDNSAASMLQVFDFRKMLISYYVKSIIYYAVMSPKLEEWINSPGIKEALQTIKDKAFVDLDPVFNMNIDEDYDYRYSGITKNSFCSVYVNWIRYCNSRREKPIADVGKDSSLVTLCFALSLLGRRTLGTASHNTAASVEFFLYGVHTLFKGDFRIASVRDEWVFSDMELLRKVVAPAIRMSLKLHQDHFMSPDEYECSPALFSAISSHQENLVISHEGDPVWRKAVLSGMPSLLALRRVIEEGSDDYKIIMLNKRFLSFRVIKMNRECVRGLWAGQQQELIFLRNLNSERGSIQNAKQALRNIINSSCDQPIGYPIFVSPLTTSYAETNAQFTNYFGGPVSIKSIKNFVFNFCRRVRKRCVEGCSSGSSAHSQDDGGFGHEGVYSMTTFNVHSGSHQSMETSLTGSGGTITRVSAPSSLNRSAPSPAGPSKPGLVTLAGLLSPPGNPIPENIKIAERKPVEKEDDEKEPILHRVKIIDPGQVHDGINQGRLIDVIWPDEVMRQRGGRNFWKDWVPEAGMEGQVVHRWIPNHPNPNKRSTFDRTILLVKIEDKYVPISENGVQDLGAEV